MTDWRLSIPDNRRRIMSAWFVAIAVVTLLVLIVGGTTRLTHSGLSIVDWDPIMGVVPPITHEQWQATFERYQQFPQYQKVNQGMTLGEFQFIFFWEYLHRLLARSIGLVFLVPFAFFLVRRWMNRPLALRSLALFGLGGMQGVMGWLMVASGLVDRPSVSHYRLAAHLSLAFLIFGYALWLSREMRVSANVTMVNARSLQTMKRGLLVVGWLLALQIVWGAFVAGLKAGFLANTFPLMGGRLVPATLLSLQPAIRNFFENQVTVQWLHRVIGTLLGIAVLFVSWRTLNTQLDRTSRRYAVALMLAVLLQYVLGVLTLVNAVPVALGVMHQAMAMILFGIWVTAVHHARTLRVEG
jgi:heme a synthase